MGVPVVATNVGGNSEVVSDGQTGFLVPVKDPRILANACGTILKDRAVRSRMAQNGPRVVSEHFSHRAMARKVRDSYRDFVDNRQMATR